MSLSLPLFTCSDCPWLKDDWYPTPSPHKRCGLSLPNENGPTGQHNPQIRDPARNGCSFHPLAQVWAHKEWQRFKGNDPVPEPSPPSTPERRRAIRSE